MFAIADMSDVKLRRYQFERLMEAHSRLTLRGEGYCRLLEFRKSGQEIDALTDKQLVKIDDKLHMVEEGLFAIKRVLQHAVLSNGYIPEGVGKAHILLLCYFDPDFVSARKTFAAIIEGQSFTTHQQDVRYPLPEPEMVELLGKGAATLEEISSEEYMDT